MGPPRSARGELRRAAVLAVARRVLVDEGLDRFALRHIATQAGITLGNLQYYFATRDDLLEAIVRVEFDRDLGALRAVTTAPGERALREIAAVLLANWCGGGGGVFTTLSLLAYHHERFRELNREIYQTFHGELATLITTLDTGASESEATARARLITAVLDGVAVQAHADVCRDQHAWDDLLARSTALVIEIAAGHPRPTTPPPATAGTSPAPRSRPSRQPT